MNKQHALYRGFRRNVGNVSDEHLRQAISIAARSLILPFYSMISSCSAAFSICV